MLKSILSNKFPSKDNLLHSSNFCLTTSEFAEHSSQFGNQRYVNHGCLPQQNGGILDCRKKSDHHNVKRVHFADGCRDEVEKGPKDNGLQKKSVSGITENNGHVSKDIGSLTVDSPSFASLAWAPRLTYLSEIDSNLLKQVHARPNIDEFVSFCENQAHLNFGLGPDYSCTFIGLMSNGTDVAVKKINKKRVAALSKDEHRQVVTSINNPSLAKVWFITCDKTHYYIVRELCEHSLAHNAKMRGFIPLHCRPSLDHMGLCYKIACSVAVLHRLSLPHMSLKPENIFLNASGDVKLADFQLHERCSAKKKQYVSVPSSLAWLPSELLSTNPAEVTLASDICSLGMIFYWIITEGGHPFGDHLHNLDACLKNCKSGRYNLKTLTDPFAHHLLQHMIYKEPEKRFTINEVLGHPYFWAEHTRLEYLELIAVTYRSDTLHVNAKIASQLKKFLLNKERVIERLSPEPEPMLNVDNTLEYVHEGIVSYNDSHSKEVLQKWPGFVLETYNHFSIEDLERVQENNTNHRSVSESDSNYLKPCLSVDSGVHMTYNELIAGLNDPVTKADDSNDTFESRSRFTSGDSECYSFSDYGIDLMSPDVELQKSEFRFAFPSNPKFEDSINKAIPQTQKDELPVWKDRGESVTMKNLKVPYSCCKSEQLRKDVSKLQIISWTNMDELD